MKLFLHQSRELAQTHLHDGARLHFSQLETFHQVGHGLVRCLGRTDNADHLINMVGSDDKTFQNMRTLFRLSEIEASAPENHLMAVFKEQTDQVFQGQQFRTAMDKRDVVHAERTLQGRHLEKLVEHYTGVGVTLHVDDNTHSVTVALVVHI